MRPDLTVETTLGVGRNCIVFNELRAIAYREVREFKRSRSVDMFQARLEHVALGINLQFPQALKLGEVRAIAKSVARWTWRHFDDETFRARQSFLGKRANAKRWAGHVSSEKARPWVTEGISRATWYRRRAKP
jgi:primase-like protein